MWEKNLCMLAFREAFSLIELFWNGSLADAEHE